MVKSKDNFWEQELAQSKSQIKGGNQHAVVAYDVARRCKAQHEKETTKRKINQAILFGKIGKLKIMHEKEMQELQSEIKRLVETEQSKDYNRKLDIAEAEHQREMQELMVNANINKAVAENIKIETAKQIFSDFEDSVIMADYSCEKTYNNAVKVFGKLKKKYGCVK